MKSTKVSKGQLATYHQYNDLRQDAEISGQFLVKATETPSTSFVVSAGKITLEDGNLLSTPEVTLTVALPTVDNKKDLVLLNKVTGEITISEGAESAIPASITFVEGYVILAEIFLKPGTIITNEDDTLNSYITNKGSLFNFKTNVIEVENAFVKNLVIGEKNEQFPVYSNWLEGIENHSYTTTVSWANGAASYFTMDTPNKAGVKIKRFHFRNYSNSSSYFRLKIIQNGVELYNHQNSINTGADFNNIDLIINGTFTVRLEYTGNTILMYKGLDYNFWNIRDVFTFGGGMIWLQSFEFETTDDVEYKDPTFFYKKNLDGQETDKIVKGTSGALLGVYSGTTNGFKETIQENYGEEKEVFGDNIVATIFKHSQDNIEKFYIRYKAVGTGTFDISLNPIIAGNIDEANPIYENNGIAFDYTWLEFEDTTANTLGSTASTFSELASFIATETGNLTPIINIAKNVSNANYIYLFVNDVEIEVITFTLTTATDYIFANVDIVSGDNIKIKTKSTYTGGTTTYNYGKFTNYVETINEKEFLLNDFSITPNTDYALVFKNTNGDSNNKIILDKNAECNAFSYKKSNFTVATEVLGELTISENTLARFKIKNLVGYGMQITYYKNGVYEGYQQAVGSIGMWQTLEFNLTGTTGQTYDWRFDIRSASGNTTAEILVGTTVPALFEGINGTFTDIIATTGGIWNKFYAKNTPINLIREGVFEHYEDLSDNTTYYLSPVGEFVTKSSGNILFGKTFTKRKILIAE